MPLRIWMPSCAAGPLNTAAWPSTILFGVTPDPRRAASDGNRASARTTSTGKQRLVHSAHLQERCVLARVPRRRAPSSAGRPRRSYWARSQRWARLAAADVNCSGIAQAERAFDQQRRAAAEALVRAASRRAARSSASRWPAEEGAEVAHAVEVAAHVGDAPEPRLRERHRRNRRHRDHLAGLLEVDSHASRRRPAGRASTPSARRPRRYAGAPPARAGIRAARRRRGRSDRSLSRAPRSWRAARPDSPA